jgi:uncharacterized protein (DUF488 family)
MTPPATAAPLTLYTVGHSTRTLEALVEILHARGVKQLADVRTIPRSRCNPQFNTENLSASLQEFGIDYAHIPSLGGLRHPRLDSRNTAWRNASFRGFADYMQTTGFATGLDQLMSLALRRATAIMCAEAVPWRCHRSLIADAVVVQGAGVEHILSLSQSRIHTLTPFARVRVLEITYPDLLDQDCQTK